MGRLASGIAGFDGMLGGGLPEGGSIVLQGPPGQEKLLFALTFLAEGLKQGSSGVLVISSQSAESILSELRRLGVDLDAVAKEDRLRIVDWYSWAEETITDVEERGIILRSSIDLSNAGAALSRAIASLRGDQPKRAVVEILSPATNVYELNQVYAFAQSSKRKFERFNITGLFLLEKEMHAPAVLSTLTQPFDGVIEMERTRTGDRIIRKIGVLHMKETAPVTSFIPLEMTDKGFRVVLPAGLASAEAPAPPPAPASTEGPKPPPAQPAPPARKPVVSPPLAEAESMEDRRKRVQLIMAIAKERLRADPADKDAWFALAAGQATANDVEGSLASLEKLVDLDQRYPGLWVLKAKLHARLGQEDEWQQARMKADQYEEATAVPAGDLVPCPVCAKPIAREASLCPHCGSRTAPEADIIEELESLTKATIQDIVQEEAVEEEAREAGIDVDHTLDELAELVAAPPTPPSQKVISRKRREEAARKGLTNGLIMERSAARRVVAAAGAQGRTNGLTNGLRGRTNGLTNGLGRTNGLTNGLGRTNGLTNGLRGRTNGLTNGLRGRTNGLTNGLGRTNGLTNGLGRTNGLKKLTPMGRLQRRFASSPLTRYGLPIAVVALLILPLFFLWGTPGPSAPIQIDGNFSDWTAQALVNTPVSASADPNIRITRFGIADNLDDLAFYVEVAGTIFTGGGPSPGLMDAVRIFVDVDSSGATGYQVDGIGADRLLEVSGHSGRVLASSLHEFDANRDRRDWNGWIKGTPIEAAASGSRVEIQAQWIDLQQGSVAPVATVHTQAWDGQSDDGETLLSPTKGTLVLEQTPTPPQTLSGNGVSLLAITATALRQGGSFDSVDVQILGTAPVNVVSSLRLLDSAGGVLSQVTPTSRNVIFRFATQQVDASSTRTYVVRGDFIGSGGETLGLRISSREGVGTLDSAPFLRNLATTQSLGYIGGVPAGPQVDGAFAEWSSASADPTGEPTTRGNENIDLARYGAIHNASALYLYADVTGRLLAGTAQPASPSSVPPTNVTPSADSDRDSVPDAADPMPFDFNNDGVPDAQTNGDYDGDQIIDYGYPSGTDFWLNTTLPQSFPAPYAGLSVSVYIGPTQKPPLLGEDVLRIFLDVDNTTGSGYSIGGIGADRLIEVRGKDSQVTQSALLAFSGSFPGEWSWSAVSPLTVATGYHAIELSVPMNATDVYVEIGDFWGSTDSTSTVSPLIAQVSSFQVSSSTTVLSVPWFQTGAQPSATLIDGSSNSATTIYNQQRKVVRAGDVAAQSACDATNSDGCWYVVFYDQLAQDTYDSAPSTETLTTGTRISGAFSTDIQSSNNAYIDYREADTGAQTILARNAGAVGTNPACTPSITSCADGETSNNVSASSNNDGQIFSYKTFGFSLPSGATINAVLAGTEAYQDAGGDDTLTGIALSWNGGTTYCPAATSYAPPNTGDPNIYTYRDFTTCTGHTWVQADFIGDNIAFQATHTKVGQPNTIFLDAVVVQVTYSPIEYTLSIRHTFTSVPNGDTLTLGVEAYHSADENVVVQVLTPPNNWNNRITITATSDPNTAQTYVLTTAEYNSGSPSIRFVDTVTADTTQSDLWVDLSIITTTMKKSPSTETITTGSKISGTFASDVSTENNVYIQYRESAIAFDAVTTPATDSGPTFTWSHTTSGTGRLLVVGVAILNDASQTVSSVTYNGTALTFIRADTNGANVRTEIWYLVGPSTGANNVVVTLSASARAGMGATSLTGVSQASALDANNGATGSSATPATTVTTVSDNAWVVDVMGYQVTSGGPTATVGPGQTQRWSVNTNGAGSNVRGRGSTEGPKTPAGNVVMNWTLSTSNAWAISAASFKPGDALSVRYDWSGVPAGDVYTLKVKGYRQDEDIRVDVFDPSTSSWNGRITISSTTNTLYSYGLTTSEYNSGSPAVRFVDATGADAAQSDVWIDEAVIVTTSYWDRIYIMRSLDASGSTWGSPVLLASGRVGGDPLLYTYDSAEPSIAIDSTGYLHVVWVSAGSTGNQQTLNRLRYTKTTVAYPTQAQLASAANWQTVTVVDDSSLGYMPTVSTDTSSNPHIAWSSSKTSGTVYYKNMYGAAWKPTVSWGSTYTGFSVDVSPQNNYVSLVRYYEAGTNEIQYTVCKNLASNNCDATTEFTKWDGTGGYDTVATSVESGAYPSLATTYEANGDLWIAYAKDVDGTTRAIFALFLDYPSTGFAGAETVDSFSGTRFTRPTIGVDKDGNVHALYVAASGPQAYYKARVSGVWGSRVAVDTSSDHPSLVVRAPNNATYGASGAVYWKSSTSETYFYFIPEFEDVVIPVIGVLLVVFLTGRRARTRKKDVPRH